MGLVMSKSLSTQLQSAHFPGSSLSDTEVFPKLLSPCGAEHLLLVGRTQGKLSSPSTHRTQLSAGKRTAAPRLDAGLDLLSNNTSQVLDWQRPKL